MLVEFYKILMIACVNALIPNKEFIKMTLPVHQQAYILYGAQQACYDELKSERLMACVEDSSYCQ